MRVIGSIIAREGSKRLAYKNILPFRGENMLGVGIRKLLNLKGRGVLSEVVVSTESELVARVAYDYGVEILRRPGELAGDGVPSVPVFRHIMGHYEGEMHVNLNINFPLCEEGVVERAIEVARESGEALSVPYAVWAQTRECLENYGDFWTITARRFEDERAGGIDIHTVEDLLETYRGVQGVIKGW